MDNWISNDDESVDMKAKNSLLSSLIVKTGGVTFLAYLIIGLIAYMGFLFELEWSFVVMLKLGCLYTNVAWYWISLNDDIRQATDKMLTSAYAIVIGLFH